MEAQIRISWLVTISGKNKIEKFLLLKITTWYIPPYRQNERCNMFQIKITGTQMYLGPKLNSLGTWPVFYSDHKIGPSLFQNSRSDPSSFQYRSKSTISFAVSNFYTKNDIFTHLFQIQVQASDRDFFLFQPVEKNLTTKRKLRIFWNCGLG